MTRRFPKRLSSRCLLGFLLALCAPSLRAEEAGTRLRGDFLLSGANMRQVFRDVVSEPRRWTVQFLKGDEPVALGTVVEQDGWILTKASQVKEGEECLLQDGRRFPFEIVGHHTPHDLALVKISVEDLEPVLWEERSPAVGDWLVTAGIEQTPVAVGIMSVPRRSIPRSDAHGVLGIRLDPENLPRVVEVIPNGGAFQAGLQEGDVILQVDKHDISDAQQLIRTLRQYRPGDTLTVRVQREKQESIFSVTLTHPFGDFLSRIAFQNQMGGPLSFRRDDFEAVYQHDTVLKPEECGGPVVTLSGKALGINIARAGRTESYVLPSDLILAVLDDLKAGNHPPPISPDARPESPALPELVGQD